MKVQIGLKPAIWEPRDGREPITFMVAPLAIDKAIELAEAIRGIGPVTDALGYEAATACLAAVMEHTRSWIGLVGDPECNEGNKRNLFAQEPGAAWAVLWAIAGTANAMGITKKASGGGSSSASPTPEPSAGTE